MSYIVSVSEGDLSEPLRIYPLIHSYKNVRCHCNHCVVLMFQNTLLSLLSNITGGFRGFPFPLYFYTECKKGKPEIP